MSIGSIGISSRPAPADEGPPTTMVPNAAEQEGRTTTQATAAGEGPPTTMVEMSRETMLSDALVRSRFTHVAV